MILGALVTGGRLWTITSSWLRCVLPEWKGGGESPAIRPAGLRRVLGRLRKGGFDVEAVYGLHGPLGLAWGFASRLPAAVGREDLVDRCFAAMSGHYLVPGWQAHWAPVAVVRARKR
jgi:hypothetical protein